MDIVIMDSMVWVGLHVFLFSTLHELPVGLIAVMDVDKNLTDR